MNLVCGKCKVEKPEEEFGPDKREPKRNFHKHTCRACDRAYRLANIEKKRASDRAYYAKNSDKLKEYQKQYREENIESCKEYQREYRKNNIDKIKQYQNNYYQENRELLCAKSREYRILNLDKVSETQKKYYEVNKEKILAYKKEWQAKNLERIKERRKEYHKKNRHILISKSRDYYYSNWKSVREKRKEYQKVYNDRDYVVAKSRMRRRFAIWMEKKGAIRETYKSVHKYIGIDYKDFVKYIESQFTPEMNWDNIHIDHYIPLNHFDPRKESDLHIAWHYLNMQPLLSTDNLRKGYKLPDDYAEHIDMIQRVIECDRE